MTHVTIYIVTNGSCVGSKAPAVGTPITKQASKQAKERPFDLAHPYRMHTHRNAFIDAGLDLEH